MRERAGAALAVLALAACCAGPAVIGGVVGSITLAAVGATAVAVLVLAATAAVFVARHRRARVAADASPPHPDQGQVR